MATFFLIIIYLAFISLGLPDSLLGSAWPVMSMDLNVSLGTAGIISMVIAGSTIVSSLLSGTVLKWFGTGKVTLVSCIMTAVALLGFSWSPSLIWLVICAIPLGIGAGSVDAGLNNYVAIHYKAHHMSWLHCFWGVGATLGPMIMASSISGNNLWRQGYLIVAGVQFILVVILFVTLPLWDKVAKRSHVINAEAEHEAMNQELDQIAENTKPWNIKGVKLAMLTFLFYCGIEASMGLWGSSFLVNIKDLPAATAAQWVSWFYIGITVGRMITGFITFKMSSRMLIRYGQLIALFGTLLLVLPFPPILSLVGFTIVGLGLAPIFPCMLHETPARFGKKKAQSIMGFQMAAAYTGSTLIPPLLGLLATNMNISIFPWFVSIFAIAMLLCTERLNHFLKKLHVGIRKSIQ
ncbi:MFS transporter [Paenibacillus macquariensis]|uniref:Fucose permease n=1 Tax=Paenibacillus macquariensis TaxID=948756 RepID=A0ABY1K5N3_9BACL|nr:MFS transporter [Paenibacillus macquariensis]MEC0090463.1 MFS transporter [Paenibacillus macquariensis]OAB35188.1 MFS transporter [Paenibacillus macquariensis subsp. macquariensis]SIR29559.1 Fucose permease [Paenibacillus macquariensis]